MLINTIYPSFDGEINVFGIGHPTIFLRTQGCHLRCYKLTKGFLCDTPEALKLGVGGKEMPVDEIIMDIRNIQSTSGIAKVTLTGGEPLLQDEHELHELFVELQTYSLYCTVETSGTVDILPYIGERGTDKKYPFLFWVLDYKLPSAGIKKRLVDKTIDNISLLHGNDFIKFVIDDRADYEEAKRVFKDVKPIAKCLFAFGLTWGSKVHNTELFKWMLEDQLFFDQRVKINFQTHKLIMNPDFSAMIPKEL